MLISMLVSAASCLNQQNILVIPEVFKDPKLTLSSDMQSKNIIVALVRDGDLKFVKSTLLRAMQPVNI